MTKPCIENNIVTFKNGIAYEMAWASEKYCYGIFGRVLLILGHLEDNARNIWCFDQDGNKLWEIEPSIWDSPYHDLKVDDDGQVRAYDQKGDTYIVDLKTGYVEWVGGDRGGDAKGANEFIRRRRVERLQK